MKMERREGLAAPLLQRFVSRVEVPRCRKPSLPWRWLCGGHAVSKPGNAVTELTSRERLWVLGTMGVRSVFVLPFGGSRVKEKKEQKKNILLKPGLLGEL